MFLVLLLLSNSSLALEILTHDVHQHAGPQASELSAHSSHSMTNADNHTSHGDVTAYGDDDCICDDICCLSSIDFGLAAIEDHPPSVDEGLIVNPNFYRSISLDLFLPPPTH